MGKSDHRIAEIGTRQLGLVTRAQLRAAGLATRTIYDWVARGRLVRRFSDVFAIHGSPRSWEQDALAGQLAVGDGCAISHHSAGRIWRLEAVSIDAVDVMVTANRRVRLAGLRVHRTRTLIASEVAIRKPFRLTTPSRTLIDLAGVLDEASLEDAFEDALRRKIVHLREMHARVEALGRGVPGIGTLKRLIARHLGAPVSGSSLEVRFRRLLRDARLPPPVQQHVVRDPDGRAIARVDFAYPDVRLAIEVDGYAFHGGRRSWEADLSRQNRLVAAGWRVLRVTSSDLHERSGMFSLLSRLIIAK